MRAEGLLERQAQRWLELVGQTSLVLRDAGVDDYIEVLGAAARALEAITSGTEREREGVLPVSRDAPLVNACECLEVDVGLVPHASHQLIGRQPALRQLEPDAGEAAGERVQARL